MGFLASQCLQEMQIYSLGEGGKEGAPVRNDRYLSQGPSWGEQYGEQILPWGSLCERTPLGYVLGNLAQAKTMVAHRTLFVFKSSVMYLSPFVTTTVTV